MQHFMAQRKGSAGTAHGHYHIYQEKLQVMICWDCYRNQACLMMSLELGALVSLTFVMIRFAKNTIHDGKTYNYNVISIFCPDT